MRLTTTAPLLFLTQILLLITGCCCPQRAGCQNYIPEVNRYSVKEGLPDREVNSVIQDQDGFIWIATRMGVSRFDGYHFRTWTTEDGLPTNNITWLLEDALGYIWAGDEQKNVTLIDQRALSVMAFDQGYPNQQLGDYRTKTGAPFLCQDSTLYWSNPKSIVTYHPKRGARTISLQTDAADPEGVFTLDFVSPQKTLWGIVTSPKGQSVLELDSNGVVLQRFDNPSGGISYVVIGRHPEGQTNYYNLLHTALLTASCLKILPDNSAVKLPSNAVFPNFNYTYFLTSLCPLNDDGLVFSDYAFYDTKKPGAFLNLNGAFEGVSGRPRGVIVESSGKVWMGSRFGLIMVELHPNHFNRLLFTTEPATPRRSCRSILEKDGHLYVNVEGGLFCDNVHLKKISNPLKGVLPTAWFGLTDNPDGHLYAANALELVRLTGNPPSVAEKIADVFHPWTIYSEGSRRLWVGTSHGLEVYDLSTGALSAFTQYNGYDELDQAGIVAIQPDRQGNTWLCATTGFYRLDLQKGIQERHWTGGKGTAYLPFDNFTHYYEDAEGVFWLTTLGGGLIRWDRAKNTTAQYLKKAGFNNATLYAVYEDDHQHLWIPSDNGIVQFDKTSGTVRRIYLEEDGITDHEFNRTSHYRGQDGTFYFGGLNGVTAFNPNDFYGRKDRTLAPLVVTQFRQFDGTSNQLLEKTGDLLERREITLQPDDRFFDLEFALLTYTNIDKIQYAYKIDGIDPDWIFQREPHLRLSRLPYGSYHLHIKGQAANGLWGANELDINIRVLRPFYLQFWFLFLCLVGLAMSARLFLQWRTRTLKQTQAMLEAEVARQTATIRQQTEALREMDAAKSRLYTNITHEFRTPLTVILGMADEIEQVETAKKAGANTPVANAAALIRRNGKNLLRLINQLLDISKLDAGAMTTQLVQTDIIGYLQYLTESFYSLAQERKIRLIFYPEIPSLVMDFDEEKVQIIVYNLLSNALKFTGEGGKVVLHAAQITQQDKSWLQLKVQDTGVGIAEAELPHVFDRFYQADSSSTRRSEGTGIGLALVKELVDLMEGHISVESTLHKGTTFVLRLPFRKEIATPQQTSLPPHRQNVEITATTPEEDHPLLPVSASPEPGPTDKPLLLIVEDNLDVATYIEGLLQHDYQIEKAANGKIGIEKALEMVPDIIISDVMMPEKDGYEVCATLKTDERTSHIPIILLTAKASQSDKIAGLKVGADAYLEKPFDKTELFIRLEKLVELRRRLQARMTGNLFGLKNLENPAASAAPTLDDRFLQKIRQVIEDKMGETDLGILHLCRAAGLSHTQVFRKLKALTGENPTNYIRTMRLQRALQLLKTTEMNVSEIAYEVGFSDPNYFSRTFHEAFGKAPSAMRK